MRAFDVSTKEGAISFYESGEWREMTAVERCRVQLGTRFCCIPWSVFGASLEEACGRYVNAAETLNEAALLAEIEARNPSAAAS